VPASMPVRAKNEPSTEEVFMRNGADVF